MDNIKVRSINIQGLRNKKKRTSFFHFVRHLNIDVICIQEAYIIDSDIHLWEKEWGGQLFFCVRHNPQLRSNYSDKKQIQL